MKGQKPTLYAAGKTVAFNVHDEEDAKQMKRIDSRDTLGTARSSAAGGGGGKGLKWFEKIAD